jgi:CheY-like chemotaxis protein
MNKKSYSVLFVDDEPWNTQALRLSLEARGFNCISRTNMSDAWQTLQETPIDVVVTDIMMPAGESFPDVDSATTGFFFVKVIREKFPRLPIICLSVIADPEKIESLKKKNVLYLRKGETPLDTAIKLIESKATGLTSFG